jgi:hypothetical protein
MADPAGKPIAVLRISHDSAGFARLLAAIVHIGVAATRCPDNSKKRLAASGL